MRSYEVMRDKTNTITCDLDSKDMLKPLILEIIIDIL